MSPFTLEGQTRERVYRYVRARVEAGVPPTVREVQQALGVRAVETARKHLERLVRDGRLEKQLGVARGYRLPARRHRHSVAVPLLGRVPAGGLLEAIEDPEGSLVVEARSAEGLFALRVRGDSMVGTGILPGDVVIVRAQPTARSGDIVVALVDGEATVKTLRRTGRQVTLCPENPAFAPIVPPKGCSVTILGKVIEVRRHLETRG